MVATIGIMIGYIVGNFAPDTINAGTPGPVFMALVAIVSAFGVAYIAFRGVNGSTMVNIAINGIQITALLFFSALAIAYRLGHPEGSMGLALDGTKKVLHYALAGDTPAHPNALSVIAPHNFSYVMLQATIAIFLLVGFESVTALGEEAKDPKRDIPRGVLLSLTIQGLFCYMIEYFAANYFMSSAYSLADAKGSAAPIGDMMTIIGNALLGGHGQAFMMLEALTVFLALDRHHALLHQHRRARHLRDGPRRGSTRALRSAARRQSDSASHHLDARGHFGGARRLRGTLFLRRWLGTGRQDDRHPAA